MEAIPARLRSGISQPGIRRHKLSGHRGKIRGVAFSPDRTRIVSAASGRDQTIILWDVHAGKNIKTLENHTAGVASVTFSLEGDIIASGSYDNRVHLWDIGIAANS